MNSNFLQLVLRDWPLGHLRIVLPSSGKKVFRFPEDQLFPRKMGVSKILVRRWTAIFAEKHRLNLIWNHIIFYKTIIFRSQFMEVFRSCLLSSLSDVVHVRCWGWIACFIFSFDGIVWDKSEMVFPLSRSAKRFQRGDWKVSQLKKKSSQFEAYNFDEIQPTTKSMSFA